MQEGLTNARKHAPGRPVRLLLDGRPGDRLLVELTNPVGPPTRRPRRPGRPRPGRARHAEPASQAEPSLNGSGTGTGLIGLTERVRLTGGEIDHGVGPDGEFLLRALAAVAATSATPVTLTGPAPRPPRPARPPRPRRATA